ncbi:MAG: hypothetical protein CML08_02135 [Puniceicoccaceae bacterium]|nr:hypothetical protein [Puniceicoccaceae bacterium]
MADYNFDSNESHWDHFSNESNWNEAQWRNYLRITEKDSARFLSIYNTVKDKNNHLDEAASLMGWDGEDISLIDEESNTNHSEATEELADGPDQPYTLHKHPVFIVTKSLYKYIKQSWEHLLKHNTSATSVTMCPELSWNFAKSIHNGELNILLAIQALDLGDYGLAICHLKNSLSELNQSLKLLEQLSSDDADYLEAFRQELKIRIFDLRELWIRVMNDCRHESQRRSDNKDSE